MFRVTISPIIRSTYAVYGHEIYFRSQHTEWNELGNVEPSASDPGTEHGPSASNFSCNGRGCKCMKLGSCETDSIAPSQEFLCLSWNPRIHWRVTKIPPPDPVPRQLSPVRTQASFHGSFYCLQMHVCAYCLLTGEVTLPKSCTSLRQ